MAIAKTDWEQYRATNSDILPDIFFRVLQDRDKNMETEAEYENGDKTKLIRAHKMLLAGTSPVFKANFFGPMKMTGEVMEVRETTIEAFATLINFIYWPPGKPVFSLKHITGFEELCNIVEISERYQIMDLKQLATEAIKNLEVTAKDVIIVATIADRYKAFEDIREILMNKNVAYLEETMKSPNDVISFMIATKNDFPENGLEMLIDLFKEKQKKSGNNHNINSWGRTIFSKPEEQTTNAKHMRRELEKDKVIMVPVHVYDFKKLNDFAEAAWVCRYLENSTAIKERRRQLLEAHNWDLLDH